MEKEELLKRYNTWIKGSVGTVSLMFILSFLYFIRAFIQHVPTFWFNFSYLDLFFKNTDAFEGYDGKLPLGVAIALSAVCIIIGMVITFFANKDPKNLKWCFVYCLIDSIVLAYIMIFNPFSDVDMNMFIAVITHAFLLINIIVGMVAVKKKKELNLD